MTVFVNRVDCSNHLTAVGHVSSASEHYQTCLILNAPTDDDVVLVV